MDSQELSLQPLKAIQALSGLLHSHLMGPGWPSGSSDKTVKIWDGLTGALIAVLKGHLNVVLTVAFSPDGSRLASGSYDNTVAIWDGLTGALIAVLKGHSGPVQTVAFSPDGSRLASGSDDGAVRLWDGLTGAPITTLEGHLGSVRTVAFSPDGSSLVSGSDYEIVKLWDGLTGACIKSLKGHSNDVLTVAFSPDGSRLASGSYNTVKLWDGFTGALIATLKGHSHIVCTVAFSPDGSRLQTQDMHNQIKYWDSFSGAPLSLTSPELAINSFQTGSSTEVLQHSHNTTPNAKDFGLSTSMDNFPLLNDVDAYHLAGNAIMHTTTNTAILLLPTELCNPFPYQFQGLSFIMGFNTGRVVILNLQPLHSSL
jgi:WD40 repeat protein